MLVWILPTAKVRWKSRLRCELCLPGIAALNVFDVLRLHIIVSLKV